ncbi:hypothetical protein [Actinoplanes nipponensis]|uniref:hypothetical protein n=1 Tax=Actinoplanes nipponensis TaxID=135950 RepID=UPI0031E9EEE7
MLAVAEPGQLGGLPGGQHAVVELPQVAADHARVQLAEQGPDPAGAPAVDIAAAAADRRDPEVGDRPVGVAHRADPGAADRDHREDLAHQGDRVGRAGRRLR